MDDTGKSLLKNEHLSQNIQMKRSISLVHCVAILFALTGHVSVFITPNSILRYTGSVGLSLVVWFCGGLINLCLALCFTELATMMPKAGGPYAYVMHVFGPLPAFLLFWSYLLLITGPFWAYNAYTAAIYVTQPFYKDCKPPETATKLIASWIIVTFVVVNCVYVKFVTKVQTVLAMFKLLGLAIIIVCGAIQLSKGDTENLEEMWDGTSTEPGKIAVGFFYSVFIYGAWQIITNLMEEVKEPGRDLPRAVFVTFAFITTMCVLANVAYSVLLTPYEILQSDAVAVSFFQRFYRPLTAVISVLVAVTAIGVLNASILGHSRVLFAASRYEQAPVLMSMIHTKFLTPWPAISVMCIWSLIMLFSGGLMTMMELISLASILLSLFVITTLLYLRWKEPLRPRPYKINIIIPISHLILCTAVLLMCLYQEPYKLGRGLLIVLAGLPVYMIGVKWKSKPVVYKDFIEGATVTIQKVFKVRKAS